MDPVINLIGGDPRLDAVGEHIKNIARKLTAAANTFDLGLGFDDHAGRDSGSTSSSKFHIFLQMAFLVFLSTAAPAGIVA
jgi:hypothetical protein